MLDSLLAKIGEFFSNLAIPFEIVDVFRAVTAVWSALPFVLQVALVACFSVACLLAILKMLF